ncbi:type I-A CRISPR-associated protein CsaX [Sulfurisphaera tokodaii]|uniref:Type I-A CRISPR-associated protein CsaX n=1 Tax=Sulfurisphaera tokodaii TaxID=111955 RepID=A0A832TJI4_9CREN|nr:type I-A CRISPR-associated protein CsaX [Sulfurisphaera tokodaii]HII75286.1 type I-A CRISPR-associated protein CsaX [Sulfurisphaera tokodaii]
MIVPLYNLFGDNLVTQLAVNTKELKPMTVKGKPYLEIDDKELRIALDTASDIAQKFEKDNKRPIPLNANDKKVMEKILKCFNFSSSDPISYVLKNFNIEQSKECYVDNVPSFIKPEYYEFVRIPGKPGGQKMSVKVDSRYVILAIAGWLFSRIGYARVGGETIGVNVFTLTKSMLYNTYGQFSGVKPETAFIFLLADRVIKSGSNISSARVYLMSDAGGQNPTVILGGFSIDFSKLLEKKELIDDDLIRLAQDATNDQSPTNDFSARIVELVYEVIGGAKRVEDLVYLANRYVSMEITNAKEFCKNNRIYCTAYYYSQKLLSEIGW